MSRGRTRARARRARFKTACAEFNQARDRPEDFAGHVRRLAASDTPVWPIAEAASRSNPLEDEERALIAQAVGPHLVKMTPGTVRAQTEKM